MTSNLGRKCRLKVEFLESLKNRVDYFGMEIQPIKKGILDQVRERIDTKLEEPKFDGEGRSNIEEFTDGTPTDYSIAA